MSSISISTPDNNATLATSFTASGAYNYTGSGTPPIDCHLEKDAGGGETLNIDASSISASNGSWSASFVDVPIGTDYTLKASLGGSSAQKTGIEIA